MDDINAFLEHTQMPDALKRLRAEMFTAGLKESFPDGLYETVEYVWRAPGTSGDDGLISLGTETFQGDVPTVFIVGDEMVLHGVWLLVDAWDSDMRAVGMCHGFHTVTVSLPGDDA